MTPHNSTTQHGGAVVAAVGVFDGVHRGHRHLFEAVRARADRAGEGSRTLAVTFDRHPLHTIAPDRCPRMLTLPERRLELLGELPQVDDVVVLHFDDDLRRLTAAQFLERLHRLYGVTDLVMGYDHSFGSDFRDPSPDHYALAGEQAGVMVTRATPYSLDGKPVSSSRIRRALAEGDVESAYAMLGKPHRLEGNVVTGRQLGRTIGFPTANLDVPAELMLPRHGVYAGRCLDRPCLVNIGTAPTVTDSDRIAIEVHIPGFSGDLYGQPLSVDLTRHIRDERKFDSLDALTAQLNNDLYSLTSL